METKMTVVAKDGTVLVGNHFHTLKDFSGIEVQVGDLAEFCSLVAEGQPSLVVYYDHHRCAAYYQKTLVESPRHAVPALLCTLEDSQQVALLRRTLGQGLSLPMFEEVMQRMRGYASPSTLAILAVLKDFRLSKVVEMQRSKDNRGNYTFTYKRESAGKGDFEPPEVLLFNIPVFEAEKDTVEVPLDFSFDYKTGGEDGVDLRFKVTSFSFEESVKEAQRRIVQTALKTTGARLVFGSLSVRLRDDSWTYLKNPAAL